MIVKIKTDKENKVLKVCKDCGHLLTPNVKGIVEAPSYSCIYCEIQQVPSEGIETVISSEMLYEIRNKGNEKVLLVDGHVIEFESIDQAERFALIQGIDSDSFKVTPSYVTKDVSVTNGQLYESPHIN